MLRSNVRLAVFPRIQNGTPIRSKQATPKDVCSNKLRMMLQRILLQLQSRNSLARSAENGISVGLWVRGVQLNLRCSSELPQIYIGGRKAISSLRAVAEAVGWLSIAMKPSANPRMLATRFQPKARLWDRCLLHWKFCVPMFLQLVGFCLELSGS